MTVMMMVMMMMLLLMMMMMMTMTTMTTMTRSTRQDMLRLFVLHWEVGGRAVDVCAARMTEMIHMHEQKKPNSNYFDLSCTMFRVTDSTSDFQK